MNRGSSYVVVMGCLQLLSFVVGYAWAAGWLAGVATPELSVGHCLLGGATLGVSTSLGVWFFS